MHGIRNFVVKEFLQMRRDPFRMRLMLVVPVVQLILLGYAANLDVKEIPAVVHDLDGTPASRELTERFAGSGYFTIRRHAARPEEVDRALARGEAAFALVIPRDFGPTCVPGGRRRCRALRTARTPPSRPAASTTRR